MSAQKASTHYAGPLTLPGEVRGTPTLFIDGVVHRGSYDAATLLEALAR